MEDRLLDVLKSVRSDVNFEGEEKLIDDGVLDSFDVVGIVSELNAEFDIEISIEDMTPDNFNNVASMLKMIERIMDED